MAMGRITDQADWTGVRLGAAGATSGQFGAFLVGHPPVGKRPDHQFGHDFTTASRQPLCAGFRCLGDCSFEFRDGVGGDRFEGCDLIGDGWVVHPDRADTHADGLLDDMFEEVG